MGKRLTASAVAFRQLDRRDRRSLHHRLVSGYAHEYGCAGGFHSRNRGDGW